MNNAFKFSIFVTSFFPLWLSILFIDVLALYKGTSSPYAEIIGIMCIVVSNVFFTAYMFFVMKSTLRETCFYEYKVASAVQVKGFTSEFLLSYTLPLFVFDFTQWDGCVNFIIYYAMLAFLCVRNNNVYANFWLEVMGYKFYSCELKPRVDEEIKAIHAIVLSKKNLAAARGNTIEITPLNKPFHIARTDMEDME